VRKASASDFFFVISGAIRFHLKGSMTLASDCFRRRVFGAGWVFIRMRQNSSHAR
jgi:hypothetical protein